MKNNMKLMKLLFGLSISISFVYLGFYLLNDINEKNNSILIKIVVYTNIIFFGFWSIIGILGFFGNTYIPEKLGMIKKK